MSIDCGDCDSFVAYAQSYFGSFLKQYGFTIVQCSSDDNGRECIVLYQSDRCRLLFTRMDGSDDCSLGTLDTPFPGNTMFYLNGEAGWYDTMVLIEFKSGKKLLTRMRIDEIWAGKLDYFAWLSGLMSDWAEELFGMFAPGNPRAWHDDFMQYMQARG